MKLNTPFFKKIIFLFLTIAFTLSCDKDDIPQKQTTGINTGVEAINNETTRLDKVLSSETITTNFSITVVDEDNNSISNATVKIANKETLTNNSGFTLIEDITVSKDFQAINVTANGYTPSIKTVTPSTNGVSNVTVTLLKPTFIKTFSATEGGVVSNDNISIEFPKDAIANQNGDLYEGEVKATVTYYNPQSENFVQSMPGTLVGLDDSNSLQSLISKGMIKVDLTDNSGNELELFEGKEATIQLPANNNDPETIPLWHLNEEKGLWVQTGTANKNGNQYVSTVKHFSTYNLDVPGETIDLTVILKDINNNLLANQKAILKAINASGTYEIEVETDNKGEFKIIKAPKGANYSLQTITDCETIESVIGVVNETTAKELSINLINSRHINFEGTLKGCNDIILSNKVFVINLENGNRQDLISIYTDVDGNFSVTKVLCDYDTTTEYNSEITVYDNSNYIIKDLEFVLDQNYIYTNINICNGNIVVANERVYIGDAILDTYSKYQEFITANYTKVTGDLIIKYISSENLIDFKKLVHVGGKLNITENYNLINLEGLENLTFIGDYLSIDRNPSLINLIGLERLRDLNHLYIGQNNRLINLEGLENVSVSDFYLQFFYNDALTDIKALSHITELDAFLLKGSNNLLDLEGLNNVKSIDFISIRDNTSLKNLNGLNNLATVNDYLGLNKVTSLENIDALNKLSTVGKLYLYNLYALNNLNGLEDLEVLNGDIELYANYNLTNLEGLHNVKTIEGNLTINSNFIENLNGLRNLTVINGNLNINRLERIQSLEGLNNITNVNGYIQITNNDELINFCSLTNLISNYNGNYTVSGNSYDPSKQDIIDGNCSN